ncbi:MAG: hypothetical protein PHY28_08540 [Dehalococcoidales bacterium]|nr:hypothetical protein [Dehalococcoidales bacterium]
MTQKALADRLMDFCDQNAEQIAEQWYKNLIANQRTPTFHTVSKESCLRHAVFLSKNLRRMYFADNPYQEVISILDASGYAEEQYSRRIPLPEVLYALILIRRQIWLNAEASAIFHTPNEMYPVLLSSNRILLVFDYALYIVTQKYEKMAKR